MLAVDNWLSTDASDSKIIMQVHDELVLEVPESDVARVSQELSKLMSGVAELAVPLKVDAGIGNNWAEAHS
jgi:DNA polymerase-1